MENMKITNKILENLNNCIDSNGKVDLDLFINLTKELKQAINYTRCSTLLLCLVDDFNFLTKDKVYKMQEEPEGHYVVIDDLGEKRLLWKKYFKILD